MISNGHLGLAKLAAFVALLALVAIGGQARAEDPTFPAGSRVGLVPPPGMVASNSFDGFADPDKNAAILITTLPAAAFAQIEKTLDMEGLRKQGLTLEKRESLQLGIGKGILLSGRQVAEKVHYKKWMLVAGANELTVLVTVQIPEQDKNYTEAMVRAALSTLAVRAKVPEAEELDLLPFSVGDLAGFRIDDVLRGRALVLRDSKAGSKQEDGKQADSKEADSKQTDDKDTKDGGGKDAKGSSVQPPAASTSRYDARLLIAAIPGGPPDPSQRGEFARLSFGEIGGIREVNITLSEPLRINGQSGYQTMAEAKDIRTGADIRVVQWLRFGGGGYLQMVGIAGAENWTDVLARLRTVRDSVEPK